MRSDTEEGTKTIPREVFFLLLFLAASRVGGKSLTINCLRETQVLDLLSLGLQHPMKLRPTWQKPQRVLAPQPAAQPPRALLSRGIVSNTRSSPAAGADSRIFKSKGSLPTLEQQARGCRWTLPFACFGLGRPLPPPPAAVCFGKRWLHPPADPCGPGSGGAGGETRCTGQEKGELGGKWRSRWPTGRMGHANPSAKGRKDAAHSEICRVGWERQERGARAGRRQHVRSGGQRWEPQYSARFGPWESHGCLLPSPQGLWGLAHRGALLPSPSKQKDAGSVARAARQQQGRGPSQSVAGASLENTGRMQLFRQQEAKEPLVAGSRSVPRVYSRKRGH